MIGWIFAAAAIVVLAAVDIKKKEIPGWLVMGATLASALACICGGAGLLDVLIGMIPGGALCLASVIFSGRIGFGDGLVIILAGVVLGFWGAVKVLFIAGVIAAGFSLVLLIRKKATLKSELPFVPFIAAAYFAVLFV